jgi:plastocyanin
MAIPSNPKSGRVIKSIAALSIAGVLAAFGAAVTPETALAQGGSQKIGMKSLKFTPKKVTVKPGTKITFVWNENVAHNIVFAKKGPKSPTLNKGVWVPDAKALQAPGTYKYKCTLHPGMDGEITVK